MHQSDVDLAVVFGTHVIYSHLQLELKTEEIRGNQHSNNLLYQIDIRGFTRGMLDRSKYSAFNGVVRHSCFISL